MKSHLSFSVKESMLVAPAQSPGKGFGLPGGAMPSLAPALPKGVEAPKSFARSSDLPLPFSPSDSSSAARALQGKPHKRQQLDVSACALGTGVRGALGDQGLFPRTQGLSGWITISLAVK